jgi:hypothetical protein
VSASPRTLSRLDDWCSAQPRRDGLFMWEIRNKAGYPMLVGREAEMPMRRYYFHFMGTADDIALDKEGSEFPHDAAAMQYAIKTARGFGCRVCFRG